MSGPNASRGTGGPAAAGGQRRRRIAGERRRAEDLRPASVPTTSPPPTPRQPPVTAPTAPPPAVPTEAAVRAGSRLWLGVAASAALVLLATAVVLGLGVWDYRDVRRAEAADQAGRSAAAAAERAAATVLSYDYRTLDADLEKATGLMTPRFAEEYADTFETYVRASAGKVKARVTAKVLATGVATASANRVEVVVFVDQTSASAANAQPSTALNRTSFTMVRKGRSWLVDDLASY